MQFASMSQLGAVAHSYPLLIIQGVGILLQVIQEGVGEDVGDGALMGGTVGAGAGAILVDGEALATTDTASVAVSMPGSESFFEK